MTNFDSKTFCGCKGEGAEQDGAIFSPEADGLLEMEGEHSEPESLDAPAAGDYGDPSDLPPMEAEDSPPPCRWGLGRHSAA